MSGLAVPAADLDVHILDVDMGSGKVIWATLSCLCQRRPGAYGHEQRADDLDDDLEGCNAVAASCTAGSSEAAVRRVGLCSLWAFDLPAVAEIT